MLFDLRGKRRRLIKVVFFLLAVAFAGSTVIFFVGSGANSGGSIFDIFGSGGAHGGGGGGGFDDQIERYEKRLETNPTDERSLKLLARAKFNQATSGDKYNQETGQFTDKAQEDLQASTSAWERYLKTDPKKLDTNVATVMVQVYAGLNDSAQAAATQDLIVEERPNSAGYAQLATYLYLDGETKKGDLAAERSIELAKPSDRKTVKRRLDRIKKQADQQSQAEQQSQGGGNDAGTNSN